MFCAIKNGFAAFRYLNDGKAINSEKAIAIPAATVPPRSILMLRRKFMPLIFLTIVATTRNAVQPTRKNPLMFEINEIPVLSNNASTKKNAAVNTTLVHTMYLLSFLRNGNARNKNPIGSMKNWIPPHAETPNASKIPAPTIFAKDIFPLSEFMTLRTKYIPSNPKKRPSGSDLNQPIEPLKAITGEIAKNSEAKSPAVVPPITLTNAKTITVVSDPITTGNNIVKS